MTINSFFRTIGYPKKFLLDELDYEIDFLFHAATQYGFNKTELLYFIIDYRDKYKNKTRKKVI